MTSSDSPIQVRHVFLVGFMGSGKSTVGAALAARLNLPFVDLDDRIEAATKCTIDEIIGNEGEMRFREIETGQLLLVSKERVQVVALGGGAFPEDLNREIVAAHGRSVWLNTSFDLCWKRIQSDPRIRPLAPNREAAETRFNSRLAFYSLADIEITVDESSSPETLARKIARLLETVWSL